MDIKQGERYLVIANGYREQVQIAEIIVLELHGKFAKTLDVVDGRSEWRCVTDLETDAVAHLPPLPGQIARFGME